MRGGIGEILPESFPYPSRILPVAGRKEAYSGKKLLTELASYIWVNTLKNYGQKRGEHDRHHKKAGKLDESR
jgi:hypothetical protein